MDNEQFVRIERVENGRRRHFVVCRSEPGFSLEVTPEIPPAGPATIRRVCLPNSWTGNYHRFSRLVAAAQSFLERCDGLDAARRFG